MKRFILGVCLGLLVMVIIGGIVGFLQDNRTVRTANLPPQIALISPREGAIIYSEALHVRGTSTIPTVFQVDLLVDDQLIASGLSQPADQDWAVEIHHAYAGDPTEANLRVSDPQTGDVYQEVVILLSQIAERPEGVWGVVMSPTTGADIGGDFVVVQGRVSGVFDETIIVKLMDDRQTIFDQHTITVHNPYHVDDMPFQVELAIHHTIGLAVVQVSFEQLAIEQTIAINLVGAAG
jgi:hypothetical protein